MVARLTTAAAGVMDLAVGKGAAMSVGARGGRAAGRTVGATKRMLKTSQSMEE